MGGERQTDRPTVAHSPPINTLQAPLSSPTTDDEAGLGSEDGGDDGEEGGSGSGIGIGQEGAVGQGAGSGASAGGCPQLVSFYDAYVNPTEGTVSIVQEYMDGGSLQVRCVRCL